MHIAFEEGVFTAGDGDYQYPVLSFFSLVYAVNWSHKEVPLREANTRDSCILLFTEWLSLKTTV